MLGSLVGALVGVPALLAVTGGGMLAIAFVTGRLPRATGTTTAAGRANGPSRIADYVAGARELTANPGARLVTLLGAAQTFIRGAMNVIVVVYAIESLGTGDSGVGALYGAMGVGGLIGLPFAVIVVGRIGVHRSMAVGVATWGLPLTICALAATPRAALVLFAIIGVGNGGVDIAYDAVLQRAVADRVLTRVLGVAEAMFQGGVAAGAFAGAILLDLVDPRPALVIVGLVLPGLALLASRRLSSLDRALDRRDHDITLLREQACFATLPINALDHLAKRMARIAFAPGEIVTRAGEPNGAYVLIESGHVEIAHGGRVHAMLGPGQGFAHIAIGHDVPHPTTVTARSAVSARAIDRPTFLAAIEAHPTARAAAASGADTDAASANARPDSTNGPSARALPVRPNGPDEVGAGPSRHGDVERATNDFVRRPVVAM